MTHALALGYSQRLPDTHEHYFTTSDAEVIVLTFSTFAVVVVSSNGGGLATQLVSDSDLELDDALDPSSADHARLAAERVLGGAQADHRAADNDIAPTG